MVNKKLIFVIPLVSITYNEDLTTLFYNDKKLYQNRFLDFPVPVTFCEKDFVHDV